MLSYAKLLSILVTLEGAGGFGPSFPLGTQQTKGPTGSQYPGGSASVNGKSFVVWTDPKAGTGDLLVKGALVESATSILPNTGLTLFAGPGIARSPSVAFAQGVFLVTWVRDQVLVEGVRVDQAGKLLDAAPFVIYRSPQNLGSAAVTASSTQFLVVWAADALQNLAATRVLPSGLVLDVPPIQVTSQGKALAASVASDGTDFLVAWPDRRLTLPEPQGVVGARITATGLQLDGEGFLIDANSTGSWRPVVGWTGSRFLVATTRWNPVDIRPELWVRPVETSASGVTIGSAMLVNELRPYSEGIVFHRIASLTVLLWHHRPMINLSNGAHFLSFFDAMGQPAAPSAFEVPNGSTDAPGSIGVTNSGVLVVVARHTDVVGQIIEFDAGVSGAPFTINAIRNSELQPSVAQSDRDSVCSWTDSFDGVRVAEVVGGAPDPSLVISSHLAPSSIAALGSSAAAVYTQETGTIVSRVQASPYGFLGRGYDPAIAAGQNNYLAAWEEINGHRIEGALLSPSGAPIGQPLLIGLGSPSAQHDPALAWSAPSYLVAWVDDRNAASSIYAVIVEGDGGVRLPMHGTLLSQKPHAAAAPTVAGGTNGWLVAWQTTPAQAPGRIEAAWVARTDAGLSFVRVQLPNSPNARASPAVAYVGDDYLLAWQESDGGNWDIVATRIPMDSAFDGGLTMLAVATSGADEEMPAIGSSASGRSLIAFTQSDEGWPTRHLYARQIVRLVNGVGCNSHEQCESTNCVDGRCCNTRCDNDGEICTACTREKGAAQDGLCGPVQTKAVCRFALSSCDVEERCDGTSARCPPNGFVAAGFACAIPDGGGGTCNAGLCAPSPPSVCAGDNQCMPVPPVVPTPRCGCSSVDAGAVLVLLLGLLGRSRRRV